MAIERGIWKLQNPKEANFTGYKGTYYFENGYHVAVVRNIEKRDKVLRTFYGCKLITEEEFKNGASEVHTPESAPGSEVSVPSGVQPDADGSTEGDADDGAGAAGADAGAEGSIPSGDGREDTGDDGATAFENRILEALKLLDPADDEHWTKNGKPRLDAVEKFYGQAGLKRSDIDRLAPDLVREAS